MFYWSIAGGNRYNGGTVTGISTTVTVQDFSPLTVEVVAFGGMLPTRSNTVSVVAGKHMALCIVQYIMMLVL